MTTAPELDLVTQQFGLGPIDQISFAVADVAEALPRYTAMFGPFRVVDVPELEVVVGGQQSRTTLRLGLGRSGSIEVELVEVVSGLWPTTAWLDRYGEGLHHIRYPVDDVAATRAAMEATGFDVLMASTGQLEFVYLASPLLNGMTVELVPASLRADAGAAAPRA